MALLMLNWPSPVAPSVDVLVAAYLLHFLGLRALCGGGACGGPPSEVALGLRRAVASKKTALRYTSL
jgi:hypothetical protein